MNDVGIKSQLTAANSDEIEQAAILHLIKSETAAYFAKDYNGWAECWIHSPKARRWISFANGGINIVEGWDEVSRLMKKSMELSPLPNSSNAELRRENMNFCIWGEMAWVTFDQIAPKTGDPFDVQGHAYEARVLLKEEGDWKILAITVMQRRSEHEDSQWIQIDGSAKIISMNSALEEKIQNHNVLTVMAGYLRAKSRQGATHLRESIDQAKDILKFRKKNAVQAGNSHFNETLPVILEDDDSSKLQICWVIIEDEMIFVSIDDTKRINQRLETAEEIYGLSTAQTRLAALIVDGADLASAAKELGVSVNTTRTHLQRIFDKTGVRSQHALVRALLSVDSPIS